MLFTKLLLVTCKIQLVCFICDFKKGASIDMPIQTE